MAPAIHENTAPPITENPLIAPTAVATSRDDVSCGTNDIRVGKMGPRKNPSSTSPTLASEATGAIHVNAALAATPTRQAIVMLAAVIPKRRATGLITKRPTVSPSQYPL